MSSSIIDRNPWETDQPNLPNPEPGTRKPQTNNRTLVPIVRDINMMRILGIWPIMILGAVLTTVVAFLYLRYTVPQYRAGMRVYLIDNANADLLPTGVFAKRNTLADKSQWLRSPVLAKEVIRKLNLQYQAVMKGQLKDESLYGKLEWQAWQNGNTENTSPVKFTIKPGAEKAGFVWESNGLTGKARWNEPFAIGKDSILVETNSNINSANTIECEFISENQLANWLSANVVVNFETDAILNLYFTDWIPARATDILNQLIAAYSVYSIQTKNQSLTQSLNFIEERLRPLSKELDSIQYGLAEYKSSRRILGSSILESTYLGKSVSAEEKGRDLKLQKEALDQLDAYVENPNITDDKMMVQLQALGDDAFQGTVGQFTTLQRERDNMVRMGATENNPRKKIVDVQLEELKSSIKKQLNAYRYRTSIQLRQAQQREAEDLATFRSSPFLELQLIDKTRQQELKAGLVNLLLQRREEAAISLAATTSDTQVITPVSVGSPVSPKPDQIYGIALLLGLLLPLFVAAARELLLSYVTDKKQLLQMVSAPLLASIDFAEEAQEKGEKLYVLGTNDRSASSEQIRSLRTNLNFYYNEKGTLFIMVTSSFSGEGKTFLSGNLAQSYALQGQNVALVEFDLRKPKLSKRMGVKPVHGLSTFLLGQCELKDIVIPDKESPYLHLIPTGPIPPNPSELMSSPRMKDLHAFLKTNYDVVIIDTPPFGLVGDAQILVPWVNITLLLIRFKVTPIIQLQEIQTWVDQGTLGTVGLVLNGMKTEGYYGYRYSPYYYKRKYGYGGDYYTSTKKTGKKWWGNKEKKTAI